MFRAFARAFAFLCRKKTISERENTELQKLLEGDSKLTTVQGFVTKLCGDYGFIDDLIYFSNDVVVGNILPQVGQKVMAVVEEEKTSLEMKAIEVNIVPDDCHSEELSYSGVSSVSLSTLSESADYFSDPGFFTLDIVCEGFEPYQGDQIEVEFYIHPETQTRKALSVRPLRHKHVYEVLITNLQGRSGVIDDSIFFTLDSLKLPDGYIPQVFDVVDAVAVENIQPYYVWRAISMSLVKRQ